MGPQKLSDVAWKHQSYRNKLHGLFVMQYVHLLHDVAVLLHV